MGQFFSGNTCERGFSMSLDTEKIHRLQGKDFHLLYDNNNNPNKWHEMVRKARDYARSIVPPAEQVRVGDVVEIVQNAIKIDPQFEEHFNREKLTQKFWVPWYAEYIVDKTFPQPDLSEA